MSEIEREKSASQEGDRTEEPSSDPAGGSAKGTDPAGEHKNASSAGGSGSNNIVSNTSTVVVKTEGQQNTTTTTGSSPQNPHFIHKLYSMLEDDDLKDLIWWSPAEDSFLIRPTERFSKALSAYFKHTNIASFVRQLNMYGFQKVSDHKSNWHVTTATTGGSNSSEDPEDSTINLWEFKHSSGYFRKGDKESLKAIKRRSSKYHISGNRKNSGSSVASNTGPSGVLSSIATSGGSMNVGTGGSHDSASWADYPPPSNRSHSYTSAEAMNAIPTPVFNNIQGPPTSYPVGVNYPVGLVPPTEYVNQPHNQFKSQPIDMKVHELNQSINGLRNENIDLQHRYELAVEELRATNLDMIKMLDLLQKTLMEKMAASTHPTSTNVTTSTSTSSAGEETSEQPKTVPRPHTPLDKFARKGSILSPRTKVSKDSSSNDQQQHPSSLAEINKFREAIYSRFQKFHETVQNSISVMDLKQQHSSFASMSHHNSGSAPTSSVNLLQAQYNSYNNNGTVPQGQMMTQQPFQSSARSSIADQHVNLMMNPFERRKSSSSSSKKRHMSVLMDPLAPAPQQQHHHTSGHNIQHQHQQQQQQQSVPPQQQAHNGSQNSAPPNVISYKPYYPYGTVPVSNYRASQLYSTTPINSVSGHSSAPSEYGLAIETQNNFITNGPQTPVNIIKPIPAKAPYIELSGDSTPNGLGSQHASSTQLPQVMPQYANQTFQSAHSLTPVQSQPQGQNTSQGAQSSNGSQYSPSNQKQTQLQTQSHTNSTSGLHSLLSHDSRT